jgi:tetratricopeptide (TPR) repeat protein
MRATPTVSLRAALVRLTFGVFVLASIAGCLSLRRPHADANKADADLAQFAKHKQAQMLELAQKRRIPVAPEFATLMAAACRADWMTVSNVFESVSMRSGWRHSPSYDPAIANELWAPVQETYGAFNLVRGFHSDNLARYREDLLDKLPAGSVLFAGTDSGRFLGTLFLDAQNSKGIILITQNGLAVPAYMDYLKDTFPSIRLPSPDEANAAYRWYMEEIRAGRVHDEGAKIEDGRICVEGVAGVMVINSQLARWIFEHNNDKHCFFVEESYVLPWIYPYLSTCGVLMRLDKQPVSTPQDDPVKWQRMIGDDFVFWAKISSRFRERPELWADVFARNTYSKMRSAIAGLYEYHGFVNAADAAYEQAVGLAPAMPEASFRLANLYMRLNQTDQAIRTLRQLEKNLPAGDPRVALTRDAIKQFETAPRASAPAK